MKWIGIATIIGGLLVGFAAWAQGPDDQYIRVYGQIMQADELNQTGQTTAALDRYQQAEAGLTNFLSTFPGWNDKLIEFRLGYVREKIQQLAPVKTITAEPSPMTVTPPTVTTTVEEANADPVKKLNNEIARLNAENARLDAKLREALSAQPAAVDPQELAKAEQHILNLQKENELLKITLREKELQLMKMEESLAKEKPAKAPAAEETAKIVAANERIKELEAQCATLETQLKSARAELDQNRAQNTAADLNRLNQELATAQARVAALEAQKVPYSPEELALLKAPAVANATTNVTPQKTTRELPAGSGSLIAEARRAYAAGRFQEAEEKYQQILKLDENNIFVLGNLAATQLEQGQLDKAEANLTKALSLEPNDAYNLSLIGIMKFRQAKFDEALDALSRATQLDPQNPEAFNYLGITLSQKGQRDAAEAALRKAIQLSPDYAGAHYNLAVVYATQEPPFRQMARYHYDKALASGQPRNPELEKLIGE